MKKVSKSPSILKGSEGHVTVNSRGEQRRARHCE